MKNILKKPIFTEKLSILEERQNKYGFIVDRFSNKVSIKEAIEKKFNVKVKKIGIINQIGKQKQMSVKSGGKTIRTVGRRSKKKKAIVSLLDGFKIDFIKSDVKDQ